MRSLEPEKMEKKRGNKRSDPYEESITDAGHVRKLQNLINDGVDFVDDKVILSR